MVWQMGNTCTIVTLHTSVFITYTVYVVAVNTHTHNYGLVAVPIRGISDVYKAPICLASAHLAHSPNTVQE